MPKIFRKSISVHQYVNLQIVGIKIDIISPINARNIKKYVQIKRDLTVEIHDYHNETHSLN